MTTQTYASPAGRINEVLGEILPHAEAVEVLSSGFTMERMPKRKGDTITYRRFLPFGATSTSVNTQNRPAVTVANHILQEGVTPAFDTITPVDVSATLQQFGCAYSYTDKVAELYEDDIPEHIKIQVGERMGLVREMNRFGVAKACTNVIYSGGTTRLTVDEPISLNALRRMERTLQLNHAKYKTRFLAPGPLYETFAVAPAYVVFCSSDAQGDIEDLPNFTHIKDYARREPVSDREIGSVGNFRFITSPELTAYADAGAAVGSTGLLSTSASNIDVYPFIVMGMDAAYDIALKGVDSAKLSHIPHSQPDKSDILGQRGYVGASFWSAPVLVNAGWMGVIEAGVSAFS